MRNILILFLIICIGVGMGITKFSPDDITALKERLWRMEQDIKNLKMERKVYFSDAARMIETWTDWTPVYGAGGAMTLTSVTSYVAKYFKINKIIFFNITFDGTTGGVASDHITFTLPADFPAADFSHFGGGCHILDGGHRNGNWMLAIDPPGNNTIEVRRYDGANWGLGANRGVMINGFYKID